MRRLNRFILILTFVLGFLVGFQLVGGVRGVSAADCVCSNWICYPRTTDTSITAVYDPGTQICYCTEESVWGNPGVTACTSGGCPTGTYVCNSESGCCDSGTVYPVDDPDPENPPVNTCGDGSCGDNETCDSCPSDCGVCCGDGSCAYGETCLSCEIDCGACPPSGPFCGDGFCNADELCDGCTADCGLCPMCGDHSCNGFETCLDCEEDCGVCPTNFAWWQVRGGNFASEADAGYAIRSIVPDAAVCIEPNCYPYLSATDIANTVESDGFPLIAGGEVSANGQISAREDSIFVAETTRTRLRETYSYFYSQYSLGFSPDDDYSGSDGDALKPAAPKDAYFHSGDMTIQSPWDVADGESYVVFVDGDLLIEDPLAVGELITVEEGGFLAFIVSGDINVDDSVGHSTLTNTAGNIEGVYIADGTITLMSNDGMDKKFMGEGTFVGWTDVVMSRDYNEGADNDLYPTETFVYRPDLVKNTPEKMKRSQMLWQETN